MTRPVRPTEIRERALTPGERVVEFSPVQLTCAPAAEVMAYVFLTDTRVVWAALDAVSEKRPNAIESTPRDTITRVERRGVLLRIELPDRNLVCRFPRREVATAFYRQLVPRPPEPQPPAPRGPVT